MVLLYGRRLISPPSPKIAQWWIRFLRAYDTLENVTETHLLHQVFPIVLALAEEAFVAGGSEMQAVAAAAAAAAPCLPDLSPKWVEVLLQRSINGHNYASQRVYLRWVFAQGNGGPTDGEAANGEQQQQHQSQVLDVCRLSEAFVLGHLLPALRDLNGIREDRDVLLREIGRFLATYIVGQQERSGSVEGSRAFLRALLFYVRDMTKSSLARIAVLGVVEHRDILARAQPCFGVAELDLARSALVLILSQHNQAVSHPLADCILACCERFTDSGAMAAPGAAESVRALLLELPTSLSLHAWSERIRAWLGILGAETGGEELVWWRDATARGVEALLSEGGADEMTLQHSSTSSFSCALACFFLRTPDDVHAALALCLHTLERLQSHPYLPLHAQRKALALLRNLGVLLRRAPHAALADTLEPFLVEPVDFLVAAVSRPLSSEAEDEAVFRFYVEALGASLGLAAQLGWVDGRAGGLVLLGLS